MSSYLRQQHVSSDFSHRASDVFCPTGDCVSMKGGTYAAIFRQLLQRRALIDGRYDRCQIEDLLSLLQDDSHIPMPLDALLGALRQAESDFLDEMIAHRLIEMDENAAVRIHRSHHRDNHTYIP